MQPLIFMFPISSIWKMFILHQFDVVPGTKQTFIYYYLVRKTNTCQQLAVLVSILIVNPQWGKTWGQRKNCNNKVFTFLLVIFMMCPEMNSCVHITWWNQSFYCICHFPEKWLCGSHVEGFRAASSLEERRRRNQLVSAVSWGPRRTMVFKVQCAGWVKYLGLFWMHHRRSGDMVWCRTLLFPPQAAQNGLHNPDLPQAPVPCGPQSLHLNIS